VTLADVSTQSPNQWLLAALAAVALVGVGGAVLLFRRRRIA
jgi:LPXTG-motif cell wall-anchored protein